MGEPMKDRRTRLLELLDVPASASTDEPAAVAPVRSGPESFESFYRRELPRLRTLGRALAGPAGEDVAQEAMLVALRRWDTVSRLAWPTGYVRRTCLHKAVSVVRRQAVERRLLPRLLARTSDAPPVASEDAESFWAAVRELPRRQGQAVALHYALDMPEARGEGRGLRSAYSTIAQRLLNGC